MLNLTTKINNQALGPKRYVYMNGLLVGEIREHSDHFQGREYRKNLSFVPVEGTWLPRVNVSGWVQKKLLTEIEHRVRARLANVAIITGYARSLVEG
jgi:hypothetical protein